MEVILRLISELRFVLVAIAGIGAAAFIFTGLGLLREMRRAVFRLERNTITNRVISSWLNAGLCVAVGVGLWAITATPPRPTARANDNLLSVTPSATAAIDAATIVPTADLSQAQAVMTSAPISESLATQAAPVSDTAAVSASQPAVTASVSLTAAPVAPVPLATPTPLVLPTVAPLPSATPAPAATLPTLPTLPPATSALATTSQTATKPPPTEPAPTSAPAAPAAPSLVANCPNPDAQIFSPSAGESISGGYVIRGTAGFNQGKYKIEILRPNIQGWAFLWEGFHSVKAEALMPNFNSRLFTPGIYTLRLMLVDVAGQETDITCTVPIRIS